LQAEPVFDTAFAVTVTVLVKLVALLPEHPKLVQFTVLVQSTVNEVPEATLMGNLQIPKQPFGSEMLMFVNTTLESLVFWTVNL
jgi:hypothetical protein